MSKKTKLELTWIGKEQHRTEKDRYSRPVDMEEMGKNDFNLKISRYITSRR